MPIDPTTLIVSHPVHPRLRWIYCETLGGGGMGAVVKVVKQPGIFGAMKVIHPELAQRREYVDLFLNEVRLQVSLHEHENIVRVIDCDELEDGTLYFVMELLKGSTLRQAMRNIGGRLPPSHVYEVVRQLTKALEHAHNGDIVHRDLKPENCFIHAPENGEAKLKVCDFGIAVLASGKRGRGVIGTPKYMAPEQCRGERVSPRTDIYAMGLMVYEMLTGRHPWDLPKSSDPDAAEKICELHLHATPIPPAEFAPWLPPALNEPILRALSKRPEDRQRSAIEFGNEFYNLQFCGGSPQALDVNITEPTLSTLATLLPADVTGERSGRSAGTETARGMTPPPMDGRSLEIAPTPQALPPAPAPQQLPPAAHADFAPTTTKPVGWTEWPTPSEGPQPQPQPSPVRRADEPSTPTVHHEAPTFAEQRTEVQRPEVPRTEGTPTPVNVDPRDEVVVTISRKTMIRTIVVIPVVVAACVILVLAGLSIRGRTSTASEPAPPSASTAASIGLGLAVVPPAPPAQPVVVPESAQTTASTPPSSPLQPAAAPVRTPPPSSRMVVRQAPPPPANNEFDHGPIFPEGTATRAPTAPAQPAATSQPDDGRDLLGLPNHP